MNINTANKQHIHELLIANMQLRLNRYYEHNGFIDGKPYKNALELLVDSILHTNTISDINDIVIEYGDLFDEPMTVDTNIFTLEGTMNYVLSLVLEYYTRFKHKSLYYEEDYN